MNLPVPLSWLWTGWMKFSHALGRVMSFLILTVLWLVGFGVYGIALQLVSAFSRPAPRTSFWTDVPRSPHDNLRYQF